MHTTSLASADVVVMPPPDAAAAAPAPDFILLDGGGDCSASANGGRPAKSRFAGARPPAGEATNGGGSHLYNRTKRKRDSAEADLMAVGASAASASSAANRRNTAASPPGHALPANNKAPAPSPFPGAPWVAAGKQYTPGVVGLHEEIEDFFQWIIPTPEEHRMRLGVVTRIRETVVQMWPKARVEIFGSFKTGLYLPSSDLDLVIMGKWSERPLRTLERALVENNVAANDDSLKVLDRASVPIIKLRDRSSGIKADISFNMPSGLNAADIIKHFKKCFPPLPKLIYVLKQFLLQRGLSEVFHGGLSSYALILMVVSFLQLHPRRPLVQKSKINLGVLLIEFLELYGRNFNMATTAIRVREGGQLLNKEDVQANMASFRGQNYTAGTICIEDPLEVTNDVGRSSYGAARALKAFECAYFTLTDLVRPDRKGGAARAGPDGRSILHHILTADPEMQAFRQQVKNKYPLYLPPATPSSHFEDPPLPQRSHGHAHFKDIEPKELPERHWKDPESVAEPVADSAKGIESSNSAKSANGKTTVSNAGRPADDSCDSLSSVSTGSSCDGGKAVADSASATSGGSSSGVGSSGGSSRASDTDSDLLVGVVGDDALRRRDHAHHNRHASPAASASPSSAMSISPATSEVGQVCLKSQLRSTKSKGFYKATGPAQGSSSSLVGSKVPAGGKVRPTFWGAGRSSGYKEGPDRADLDLNWRAAAPPAEAAESAASAKGPAAAAASTAVSSLPGCRKSLADQDTNWRNHGGGDEAAAGGMSAAASTTTLTSSASANSLASSKSGWKSGRKSKKQANKDPAKAPGSQPTSPAPSPSPTPPSSTSIAKSQAKLAEATSNLLVVDNGRVESPKPESPGKARTKTLTKKRKKQRAANLNGVSGSDSANKGSPDACKSPEAEAEAEASEAARFSRPSGLGKPNR